MIRSLLQITSVVLACSVLVLLVVLFGFFASPHAVRISPVSAHDTLLLDRLR